MPHHRQTIPVAMSALFFVCLVLHAQASLCSQAFTPYNDAEAYKIYGGLLSNDWTATVVQARRLLIQAQTGRSDSARRYIVLSPGVFHPVTFNLDKTIAAVAIGYEHGDLCNEGTAVPAKKDGLWKNSRWMGTSCAWAS
jgi:hypothetical protein